MEAVAAYEHMYVTADAAVRQRIHSCPAFRLSPLVSRWGLATRRTCSLVFFHVWPSRVQADGAVVGGGGAVAGADGAVVRGEFACSGLSRVSGV